MGREKWCTDPALKAPIHTNVQSPLLAREQWSHVAAESQACSCCTPIHLTRHEEEMIHRRSKGRWSLRTREVSFRLLRLVDKRPEPGSNHGDTGGPRDQASRLLVRMCMLSGEMAPSPAASQPTESRHMDQGTYLCLGLGGLGWPQKALAQNSAHTSSIGVVPKNWAEL